MIKKITIILLMFTLGWGIGILFNPQRRVPNEELISSSNWISRYDLYDYEEAILKNGDKTKLSGIIGEAGVERLPYIITMYDVYKEDVCVYLFQIVLLYYRDTHLHNTSAMIPLGVFLDSVVTAYERTIEGDNLDRIRMYKNQLNELRRNE